MKGMMERTCGVCGCHFLARHDRPGKFCSMACSAIGRPKAVKNWVEYNCKECGKPSRQRKGSGKNIFCSKNCTYKYRSKHIRGKNHPSWKGGSERTHADRAAIAKRKKEIKECEKCASQTNLQGHHILDYANNPESRNKSENIKILCATCHALEHPHLQKFITSYRERRGIYNKCLKCHKEYYIVRSKIGKSKWCSIECRRK